MKLNIATIILQVALIILTVYVYKQSQKYYEPSQNIRIISAPLLDGMIHGVFNDSTGVHDYYIIGCYDCDTIDGYSKISDGYWKKNSFACDL